MGLLITATENKTLKVKGLNGTVESCYLRLRGFFLQDGKTMEVQCDSYHSKSNFTKNDPLPILFQAENEENVIHCELPIIGCTVANDEFQSVFTCHKYAKQAFEKLGYTVEIVDIN